MESSARLLAPKWQSNHGKVWKTLGLKHLKESWSVVCAETPGTSHDQQNCSLEKGQQRGKKRESLSWDLFGNQFWKLIRAFSPLKFPASSSNTTKGNSSVTPHIFPLKLWCPSSNTRRKLLLCPFPNKVAVPTTDLFEFSNDHIKKQKNYTFM